MPTNTTLTVTRSFKRVRPPGSRPSPSAAATAGTVSIPATAIVATSAALRVPSMSPSFCRLGAILTRYEHVRRR